MKRLEKTWYSLLWIIVDLAFEKKVIDGDYEVKKCSQSQLVEIYLSVISLIGMGMILYHLRTKFIWTVVDIQLWHLKISY